MCRSISEGVRGEWRVTANVYRCSFGCDLNIQKLIVVIVSELLIYKYIALYTLLWVNFKVCELHFNKDA